MYRGSSKPPLLEKRSAWRGLRLHFWIGLALLVAGHILIFARGATDAHLGPLTDYWFAVVWFGYIFVVDAFVYWRDGRSLLMSHRPVFLAMLPLSGAMWWGFEWINGFVGNWHYLRPYSIPEWWANVVSWVFFRTVIPAIWETKDLLLGSRLLREVRHGSSFKIDAPVLVGMMALGVAFFVLPVVWPLYFFPLIWGAAALVLDPLNYWRGAPSTLGHIARGEWRMPVALMLSGVLCGVLWEFWNFWAFPKWYYTVPFVGYFKVFEMPLLGYIGYAPFALEVYAIFWFVASLVRGPQLARALQIASGESA
jgi:hypothetical protein